MTTFKKVYIGKGKQVQNFDIVKIFIPAEELAKAIFEKDGQAFYGLEVAKMKEPDRYGRTHTVYFQEKIEDKPEPEKKRTKKEKQTAPA